MSKILISLIGTGKKAKGDDKNNQYTTTDYLVEGKLYEEKTFTTNAIIEHYDIDKLFLIGTNQSMWDNMAEVYGADEGYILELLDKKESNNLTEQDLEPLNNLFEQKLGGKSKCFIIKDGENEDELWAIFDKFLEILEYIDNKDELYFDITHLFRSVSVMSFIFAEFGRIYKQYNLNGIFYGMLRANQPSLIINVSIFFELLEWARAIEEIENFASFNRFLQLADNKLNQRGYDSLTRTNEAFSVANLTAVHKSVKNLANHLSYLEDNDNKIIKLISPKVKQFIKQLNKNTLSEFQFAISNFFATKNNYAIAYIALTEAIVTAICEKKGLDIQLKDDREKAKDILYNFRSFSYGSSEKKFGEMYFKQINRIRNDIAHQLQTNKNPKDSIKNFQKYFQESRAYLKELF